MRQSPIVLSGRPSKSVAVAVLGGGLSGLSSCYFLQKKLAGGDDPARRLLLVEKSPRLGGWVRSVQHPTHFLFEAGPSRYSLPLSHNAVLI